MQTSGYTRTIEIRVLGPAAPAESGASVRARLSAARLSRVVAMKRIEGVKCWGNPRPVRLQA